MKTTQLQLNVMITATYPTTVTKRREAGSENAFSVRPNRVDCFNWALYDYTPLALIDVDTPVYLRSAPSAGQARLLESIVIMATALANPDAIVQKKRRGSGWNPDTIIATARDEDWDWFAYDYRVIGANLTVPTVDSIRTQLETSTSVPTSESVVYTRPTLAQMIEVMTLAIDPANGLERRPSGGEGEWEERDSLPDCFNWARYEYRVTHNPDAEAGIDADEIPARLRYALCVMETARRNPSAYVTHRPRGWNGESPTAPLIKVEDVVWDWFHNDYSLVGVDLVDITDIGKPYTPTPTPTPATEPVQGELFPVPSYIPASEEQVERSAEYTAVMDMTIIMRQSLSDDAVVFRAERGTDDFERCENKPDRFNWYKYDYKVVVCSPQSIDFAIRDIINASSSPSKEELRTAVSKLVDLLSV